ncbi:MAG TPA: helix-turn-helix domain-containing protein [Terriglobia bacterium]|nr:helix-turn-helix domain-containing protein [Terriglobia bacterium]
MPSYPAQIVYKETPKGRLIDLRSLSPKAHKAWLHQQVKLAWERHYGSSPAITEYDPKVIAALSIPPSQVDVVLKRLRVIEKAKENRWQLGHLRRGDYLKELARKEGTSVGSILRWELLYKKGGLAGLVNKLPGPAPSGHVSLRTWMKTLVERDWVWGKLTKVQCYRSLVNKVEQMDPEHKKYCVPSRTTVSRFIKDLGPFLHAYREGPEAVKRVFKGVYRSMGRNAHVLSEYCRSEMR